MWKRGVGVEENKKHNSQHYQKKRLTIIQQYIVLYLFIVTYI